MVQYRRAGHRQSQGRIAAVHSVSAHYTKSVSVTNQIAAEFPKLIVSRYANTDFERHHTLFIPDLLLGAIEFIHH